MEMTSRRGSAMASALFDILGAPEFGSGILGPAMLGGEFRHDIGVVWEMADDPAVIHAIARGGTLGMVEARGDAHRVEGADLQHVVAELGMAVAFRPGEAIVVDLGLGMMMGRIARPAAGEGDDLAQDQLGRG